MEHWWQNKARAGTTFWRFQFLMPSPRVSARLGTRQLLCTRTDLARGLGFRREEMVTWFTVAEEALQVSEREKGGIGWLKSRLSGTAPRFSPYSGISPVVTGPRERCVTLYFENTLWWQLNINMGNHSLRAVSTLHGCMQIAPISEPTEIASGELYK